MIKIITKLFTSPDKIKDSSIDVVIDPEISVQEVFDKAVKRVTSDMLVGKISEDMVNMCYTKEEIEQTEAAIEEYGEGSVTDIQSDVLKKYPNAIMVYNPNYSGYSYNLSLPFSLSRFANRVVGIHIDAL